MNVSLARIRAVTAVSMLLGSICSIAFGQEQSFNARLSTVPISAAERESTTGSGAAMATLDGRRLSVSGRFEGLQGPASGAALHESPVIGVRGPAILDLTVSHAVSGEVTATLDLNRNQLQALRDGRLYIQIASEAAPEGNLWGWLLP